MIEVKELIESSDLQLDRDYILIQFNKKVEAPRSFGKFKIFSPSIIAGHYSHCEVYNDKSYFIFESEATSHNIKARDKFFNSVSQLAISLQNNMRDVKTEVLFFKRYIPIDCNCRFCYNRRTSIKKEK